MGTGYSEYSGYRVQWVQSTMGAGYSGYRELCVQWVQGTVSTVGIMGAVGAGYTVPGTVSWVHRKGTHLEKATKLATHQ